MADQTVSLKLDADASGLKSEVQESGQAMEDLAGKSTEAGQEIEASVSGASSAWEDHAGVINGAAVSVAAMGAAVEGLARSQQDTRAVAGRLANALQGETTNSVMGLAAEIHNATTDLDELVAMMETGSQQGIRSADDLQAYALHWDMVGDATGESAAALAESSVALRALGIDAGNEGEALAAFGYIAESTTGDVGEFLRFIERTGPELRDMGADVDDAAAILGVLEHEFGMAGRTARQEFRTAVGESDGTVQGLLETLGIGQSTFAEYRGEVEASSGVIEANAEAFAESRTRVQELTASFESFLAQHSGVIDGFSSLSPILMGAGGTVVALNQAIQAKRALADQSARLAPLLRGVGTAAAGIGTFLVVREAVGALARLLQEATTEVADFTLALEGLSQRGEIPDSVTGSMDNLGGAIDQLADPSRLDRFDDWLNRNTFAPFASDIQAAEEEVESFDRAMAELVASGNDAAVAAGLDILADVAAGLGISLDELVAEHFPEYERALDAADLAQSGAGEGAGLLGDEFGDLGSEIDDATRATQDYHDAVIAATDPVFAMFSALEAVESAQQAYNDAVEEHGPKSDEAGRAASELARAVQRAESAALDGELSFSEFQDQLATWVEMGVITADQAEAIERRVADARGEAENYQGGYDAQITAQTREAEENIARVLGLINDIPTQRIVEVSMRHGVGGAAAGGEALFRAEGGPVWPGQPFIVGEKGPELVTFGEHGYVHDAATTAQAMPMLAGAVQRGDSAAAQGPTYQFFTEPTDEGLHRVRRHEVRQQAAQVAYG